MKRWTKICMFVLMCLTVTGAVNAANPTKYTSLTQDYGRATADADGNYYVCTVNNRQYYQYFRVFVPPGSNLIALDINEWNGQSAIAHHETPPISDFGQNLNPSLEAATLASLEAADQFFQGHAGTGKLSILYNVFAAPYLSVARGGWLYVHVNSDLGWSPDKYTNAVTFRVNAAVYNNWYDHAGSNPNGSINWERDVEGVTEYLEPSAKPGMPVVTPANNTVWTTAPQTITATSTKADSIYGTFNVVEYNSTTGSIPTPNDPGTPNATSSDPISANGSSVPVKLECDDGVAKVWKFRFIGKNASGLSAVSDEYTYTIDRRHIPPGDVVVTPPTATTFKSSPANITVVSSNATTIYYTTDGTPPSTNLAPVSGPSHVVQLTGTAGQVTTFNMKFMGSNIYGTSNISATYTYTIDLTIPTPPPTPTGDPPGATTVNPASGSWTVLSNVVTVSSSGATSILATMMKTTDGSTPAVPADPDRYNSYVVGTDSPASVTITGTTGKLTIINMKFAGANQYGLGSPTGLCTYTIDLRGGTSTQTPGAVAVNPTSGNWTSAGQTIAVSSANASQIEYVYSQTTDGTDPADPSDPSTPNTSGIPLLPSPTTNEIRGIISGASGNFTVPSTAGAITKIKIKFCGYNSTGYGANTQAYSYTTDLKTPVASYKYGDTITSSAAMASPGLNITSIITTAGILDPNAKFLKINSILSYSVADLVAEYLKTALNDSSLYVDTDANGVMTIGSPNFGGIVFTVITGSLVTTADSSYFKSTGTGNIEICTRNIIITMYPAGANEAIFKQTLESYGLTVSFGVDHVMLVDSPGYLMAFRFQMYADQSNLSGTGTSECLFTANANGYGTLVVTYPDGSKQNILPYVHEPEAFAALLAQNLMTCAIDPNTGKICINNAQGSVVWKGVPEFILYPAGVTMMNSEIQAMDQPPGLLFLTNIGTQVLFETN